MRSLTLLLLLAVVFSGCSMREQATNSVAQTDSVAKNYSAAKSEQSSMTSEPNKPTAQPISLVAADSAETVAAAADRKIIKNAELTLEVTSPNDAQRSVASIAESQGGFVVTSETKISENHDPSKRTVEVKLIVRVPAKLSKQQRSNPYPF